MKAFCTLSDINFLHYGITLYNSIKNNLNEEFTLYYLCTDDESYRTLLNLNLENLIPLSLKELEIEDASLKRAKENSPSYEAINVANKTNGDPKAIQFFWCLSPYLSWHVLDKYDVEDILYVDSDICFFNDVAAVYKEVGDKSVGIVRHRINYNPAVGEYNVGIVYFKRNLIGYRCAEWWKNCLLSTDNDFYDTHGVCGDQKYLELFEPLFGPENIKIIDDNVGHLAPWNIFNHKYLEDKIIWQDKTQELIYFHFSNFKIDFDKNEYECAARHGLVKKCQLPILVQKAYDQYFNEVKKSRRSINEACFRNDSI